MHGSNANCSAVFMVPQYKSDFFGAKRDNWFSLNTAGI